MLPDNRKIYQFENLKSIFITIDTGTRLIIIEYE